MSNSFESHPRDVVDECASVHSLDEKLWAAWQHRGAARDRQGLEWRYAVLNMLCVALLGCIVFWAVSDRVDLAVRCLIGGGAIIGAGHSVRERRYVRAVLFALVAGLIVFVAPATVFSGPLRIAIFAAAATPFITALASPRKRIGVVTSRFV